MQTSSVSYLPNYDEPELDEGPSTMTSMALPPQLASSATMVVDGGAGVFNTIAQPSGSSDDAGPSDVTYLPNYYGDSESDIDEAGAASAPESAGVFYATNYYEEPSDDDRM